MSRIGVLLRLSGIDGAKALRRANLAKLVIAVERHAILAAPKNPNRQENATPTSDSVSQIRGSSPAARRNGGRVLTFDERDFVPVARE